MHALANKKGFFTRLVMIVGITGLLFTVSAMAQGGVGNQKIVGTWDVLVTITNCADGTPLSPQFASLAKFEQGGTMMTQDVANMRTPTSGVWSYAGPDLYNFAFKSFIYAPDGTYAGYLVIRHDVSIASKGDQYTSAGSVTLYSPLGIAIQHGCSTTTAQRFN